jgi:hypothetical protein
MVPMLFCRNVDSLPFWHILAPRIGPNLGKVMPKFLDDHVCMWPVLKYSLALYILGDHGPLDERRHRGKIYESRDALYDSK